MTCLYTDHMIISIASIQKLRIVDGRHVWVESVPYCGIAVWLDRHCEREYEYWYEDAAVVDAVNWFVKRGKKA